MATKSSLSLFLFVTPTHPVHSRISLHSHEALAASGHVDSNAGSRQEPDYLSTAVECSQAHKQMSQMRDWAGLSYGAGSLDMNSVSGPDFLWRDKERWEIGNPGAASVSTGMDHFATPQSPMCVSLECRPWDLMEEPNFHWKQYYKLRAQSHKTASSLRSIIIIPVISPVLPTNLLTFWPLMCSHNPHLGFC